MFSELPDFLSDEECDHIIELAEMFGLEGSIMHTDEYQEKHRKEVKGTILKEGLNEVNRGGGEETRSGTEKRCPHNLQSGRPCVVVSGKLQYFSHSKYF